MKKKVRTIDATPKWMTLYPIFEEWILRGNESQRKHVCSELKKLCKAADNSNTKQEK